MGGGAKISDWLFNKLEALSVLVAVAEYHNQLGEDETAPLIARV